MQYDTMTTHYTPNATSFMFSTLHYKFATRSSFILIKIFIAIFEPNTRVCCYAQNIERPA